jgi:hypothetical protein
LSATTIIDGTGSGKLAAVTKEQRLTTLAVSETIAAHHAFDGEAYNYNTGDVTLTNANESAIAYFKNNEDEPIVISGLVYLLGNSDQTGGDTLVTVYRNPTAGTIVDDATAVTALVNRDFSSSNTLTADAYKGDQGKTLTGGVVLLDSRFAGVGRKFLSVGAIILRKGNSIGVTVTPQTSNTSQVIQIAMNIYKATETTEV